MTDESAGQNAGRFAVFADRLTRDQRHAIAIHTLHQAFSASGKIEEHFGRAQLQTRPIDQVEVGPHAELDRTAIFESDQGCGVGALALDEPFELELLAAGPIATIVEHQEGREAAVADQPAMRARISEPGYGIRIEQHLAADIEIEVGVVEERAVEEGAPPVFEKQIVGVFSR